MRIFAPEQIKIRQKIPSETPHTGITGVIYGKENDLYNIYYNDFEGNERILTYGGDWQITGIYNYFLKGVEPIQYGEDAVGNLVLGENNQLNIDNTDNELIEEPLAPLVENGGTGTDGDNSNSFDVPNLINTSNLKYNFLKGSGNIVIDSSYSTIGGENNRLSGNNNLIDASKVSVISGSSNLSSIIGSLEVKTVGGFGTTVIGINGNELPDGIEFNQNNTTYLQFLKLQPITSGTSQNVLGDPPELGTLRLHKYQKNDITNHDLEIYKNGNWETVGTPSVSGDVVGTQEVQTLENKTIDFNNNSIRNLNFSDLSIKEEEITTTGGTITPTKNFAKIINPNVEGETDFTIGGIDGSHFSDGSFLFIRFDIFSSNTLTLDNPNIFFSANNFFSPEREVNNGEKFLLQYDSPSGDWFEIANFRGQFEEVVEDLVVNQIISFEKQDRDSQNDFTDVGGVKKITDITKSYVKYSGEFTDATANGFALIDDKNFKTGGFLTIRFSGNPSLVQHDYSGTTKNRIFLHEHSNAIFYAQDQLVLQYDGNDFLEIGRKKDKQVHKQTTSAYTTSNEQLILADSGQTVNISVMDANVKGNEIKIKDVSGNTNSSNVIAINNNAGKIDGQNNTNFPDYTIQTSYGSVTLKADDDGNLWTF